jgi:RNA-splicing ligase RtcB
MLVNLKSKTCLRANFLEKDKETKQHHVHRVVSKVAFVFKESVVYPYVPYNEEGQKVIIPSEYHTDIIYYIEHTSLASI